MGHLLGGHQRRPVPHGSQLLLNSRGLWDTTKRLKDRLKRFVENAKIFSKTPEEIRETIADASPRKHHFGHCGAIALSKYQEFLERTGRIDFQDMLSKATRRIKAHPDQYREQFDHLLVDEFQDVSALGHELINTLVRPDQDRVRLFAVGDDWQSIYGFRGAAVEQFIEFEDTFGPPARTTLARNYRCPAPVVRAGNELIDNNPEQIDKTVKPIGDGGTRPTLHTLNGKGGSNRDYRHRLGRYVANLAQSFINDGTPLNEIMIVCRYDRGARYLDRVRTGLKSKDIPFDSEDEQFRPVGTPLTDRPEGAVDVHTIHQAKGREAEKVVLVHAASGEYGLPSEQGRDELLRPARDVDIDQLAEERRLFYVAITRAKSELHMTTRQNQRSRFVNEISDWVDERRSAARPGADGERVSLTAKVDQLWNPNSKMHQAGLLCDSTGVIQFISWKSDDPPTLEAGRWYRLDEVRVEDSDEFTIQLVIDQLSVIEDPLDNPTPDNQGSG